MSGGGVRARLKSECCEWELQFAPARSWEGPLEENGSRKWMAELAYMWCGGRVRKVRNRR